jgi:DNA polymerase elongation subunit (family B)
MKVLLLDIETAPNLAYVWGTWKQNITADKFVAKGYVLCWTAKWLGSREVLFASVRGGEKKMLKQIHKLLDDADAVVHYNGKSFDIPTLNKEFVINGMTPPAPYKQIDLLETVRDKFNFPINKLDYITKTLGLGGKVRHTGFQMWVDCMAGDDKAWRLMERYNRRDVVILEKLYMKLRPWVRNHPNQGLFTDGVVCPVCGKKHTLQKRGTVPVREGRYHRYQCAGKNGCGTWARTKVVVARAKTTMQGL